MPETSLNPVPPAGLSTAPTMPLSTEKFRMAFGGGISGSCAGQGAGRYTYRRDGAELRLRTLQEPCEEREAALTRGSWRRDGP